MSENAQTTTAARSAGARARVRRVTGGVVLASIALAGTIAGYVAHAAGHKTSRASASTTGGVSVPSTPAAPSLVAPGESSSDQSQSISPPSQAPSSTQQPPAAVSGAS